MTQTNSDLLDRYRAARNSFNTVHKKDAETLYDQRQRTFLENCRASSYKHTLAQSKRREWSHFHRDQKTYRPSSHPIRLTAHIRRSFQAQHQEKHRQQQSPLVPVLTVITTLPPRIYPVTLKIEEIISKQSINMDILRQTRFIGQFDTKFLVGKCIVTASQTSQTQLILFDQHAISERILLECLQSHFRTDTIRTTPFQLPQPAVISRNPRFLYTNEQLALLQRTGFILSATSTHNLLIRAVPGWLLSLGQRHRHRSSSSSLLDDIIRETMDNILMATNSTTIKTNIDLIMYETLKSLACHNAIKFNDHLSNEECIHLLDELQSCSMPFICAHGRISASLLWQYETRTSENYTVDKIELKRLASIHKWLKDS